MSEIIASMSENWVYWAVSAFAVIAAYIDGKELRVPNKITIPMIIAGWIWSSISYGVAGDGWYWGLWWSIAGMCVGLATLLPAYAIGGMGAGDVKMMAAIGAWVHCTVTFYAFCVSTIVGAILAIIMVISAGEFKKHFYQFFYILNEITTVKDPEKLSELATARKTSMRLLPYGIPLAIGTVLYFAWSGLLI
ncbi:MAG: A24 family peptidase [Planctomycetota bacterium]